MQVGARPSRPLCYPKSLQTNLRASRSALWLQHCAPPSLRASLQGLPRLHDDPRRPQSAQLPGKQPASGETAALQYARGPTSIAACTTMAAGGMPTSTVTCRGGQGGRGLVAAEGVPAAAAAAAASPAPPPDPLWPATPAAARAARDAAQQEAAAACRFDSLLQLFPLVMHGATQASLGAAGSTAAGVPGRPPAALPCSPCCRHLPPSQPSLPVQAATLLGWRNMPGSEVFQRVASTLLVALFWALPTFLPAFYMRHRTLFILSSRISFFAWPLLRKPRGEAGGGCGGACFLLLASCFRF